MRSQGWLFKTIKIDLVAWTPDLVAPLESSAALLLINVSREANAKLEIGGGWHPVPVQERHLVVIVDTSRARWQASVIKRPRDDSTIAPQLDSELSIHHVFKRSEGEVGGEVEDVARVDGESIVAAASIICVKASSVHVEFVLDHRPVL